MQISTSWRHRRKIGGLDWDPDDVPGSPVVLCLLPYLKQHTCIVFSDASQELHTDLICQLSLVWKLPLDIILIEGNYLEIEWILACKDTHSLGRIIALNQAWLGQSFYTLNVVLPRIANVSQELCVIFNMSIITHLEIEQTLPWLRAIILPKGFTECDPRQ